VSQIRIIGTPASLGAVAGDMDCVAFRFLERELRKRKPAFWAMPVITCRERRPRELCVTFNGSQNAVQLTASNVRFSVHQYAY